MNLRLLTCFALCSASCASSELAKSSPPLARMHEALDLMDEPKDEEERRALALGSFTGAEVGDARTSLDAMLETPRGVVVVRVVENSPAAAAGLEAGDLIVEARAGETLAIAWPSEWRKLELDTPPGREISIVVDRAGAELELTLTTVARVAPPARIETQRWREEERVGVVVRTATEVEARAAQLGPGGGAVVVGLSADSPWRAHEGAESAERDRHVVYGDLIRAVDGIPLSSPQVLLDKIRAAPSKSDLELSIVRAGSELTLRVPVSRRAQEIKDVSIPLLYSFERDRDASTTSMLLGLIRWRSTKAAWDVRLFWFISFSGGDSDHLETVSE